MQNKLAALILFFISTPTFADIIFINLHDSPDEERAAKAAADQRHEKLWIVKPDEANAQYHASLRKQHDDLEIERDVLYQEASDLSVNISNHENKLSALKTEQQKSKTNETWLEKKWDTYFGKDSAKIKNYDDAVKYLLAKQLATQTKIETVERKIDELSNQAKSMSKELSTSLQQIQAQGKSVSSLIISGHHVNDDFWGDHNYGFLEDDLRATLKKFPKVTDTIQALYEWGCHTGEPDKITAWKSTFPNLKLILGFLGTGPGEGTLSDHTVLQDALTREAEMMRTHDLKSAQKILNGFKNSAVTYLVGAINECYVGTPISGVKAAKLSDIQKANCEDNKSTLMELLSDYQKYKRAKEKDFLDVPDMNASVGENSIKDFYNQEELFKVCYQQFSVAIPTPEEIVNLIHFKNIQKNFQALYGGNLGSTRHDVLQTIQSMPSGSVKTAAQNLLVNLQCVPDSWITDVAKAGTKPTAPDLTHCR